MNAGNIFELTAAGTVQDFHLIPLTSRNVVAKIRLICKKRKLYLQLTQKKLPALFRVGVRDDKVNCRKLACRKICAAPEQSEPDIGE